MLKGESIGKHLGITNSFLSESQVANEYDNLKVLKGEDLKIKSYFAKKRNYFI